MNRAYPQTPARDLMPVDTYRMPCSVCDGSGGWAEIVPWAGEAIAADLWEHTCEECEGEGEVGPVLCGGCDQPIKGHACVECCVHYVIRRHGEMRCRDCGARQVSLLDGPLWVEVKRRRRAAA